MAKIHIIASLEEMDQIIKEKKGSIFYFSNDNCNVCKVLKPKILEMLDESFPLLAFYYVDTMKYPDIPAQKSIFTIPTILAFFEGVELYRKNRYMIMDGFRMELDRPYRMVFGD